jgi:hypothetical protein
MSRPSRKCMTISGEIEQILRDSDVPLGAALIADLLGADQADVDAELTRLEQQGVVHHREEWTVGPGAAGPSPPPL